MFGLIYAESVISGTVANQEFCISFKKKFPRRGGGGGGGGGMPPDPKSKNLPYAYVVCMLSSFNTWYTSQILVLIF